LVEARTPIFSDSYRGHAVRNSYSSPDLRPSHVRALSYKVALASCSRSCGAWVSHGVCALCECTHLPSLDAAVRVPGKEKASRPNLAMDEGAPLRLCVISWLTLWPHALLAHSNLYARSASLLSAGSRGGGVDNARDAAGNTERFHSLGSRVHPLGSSVHALGGERMGAPSTPSAARRSIPMPCTRAAQRTPSLSSESSRPSSTRAQCIWKSARRGIR